MYDSQFKGPGPHRPTSLLANTPNRAATHPADTEQRAAAPSASHARTKPAADTARTADVQEAASRVAAPWVHHQATTAPTRHAAAGVGAHPAGDANRESTPTGTTATGLNWPRLDTASHIDKEHRLRVASVNTQAGYFTPGPTPPRDKHYNPRNSDKLGNILKKQNLDIVSLQENDFNTNRSKERGSDIPHNTALELAKRLDPAFAQFQGRASPGLGARMSDVASATHDEPLGRNASPNARNRIRDLGDGTTVYRPGGGGTLVTGDASHLDGGEYGNAVYLKKGFNVKDARTEILTTGDKEYEHEREVLTQKAAHNKDFATSDQRRAYVNNELLEYIEDKNKARSKEERVEPRSALVVRATGPDGKEVTTVNTHLTSTNATTAQAQLGEVADIAHTEEQGPRGNATSSRRGHGQVVVTGDFNLTPEAMQKEHRNPLKSAGFDLAAVGHDSKGRKDGRGGKNIELYDQIYTNSDRHRSSELPLHGSSDHPYGALTEIES